VKVVDLGWKSREPAAPSKGERLALAWRCGLAAEFGDCSMFRFVAMTTVTSLVLFVSTTPATAQGSLATPPNFGPYYRPQLTPYLNLGRGGNPAINYYLGTLPESERRANFDYVNRSLRDEDLKTQRNAQELQLLNPIKPALEVTYGNLGTYYGNTGGYYGNGPRFGVVPQTPLGRPPAAKQSRPNP
jgi:hypothetical protein